MRLPGMLKITTKEERRKARGAVIACAAAIMDGTLPDAAHLSDMNEQSRIARLPRIDEQASLEAWALAVRVALNAERDPNDADDDALTITAW